MPIITVQEQVAKLQREFQEKLSAERVSIDMGQISSSLEGVTWYAKPLTVKERGRVQRALHSGNVDDAQIELLLLRLCDEDGKRLFADRDRSELAKMDPVVLDSLLATLGSLKDVVMPLGPDDVEKN